MTEPKKRRLQRAIWLCAGVAVFGILALAIYDAQTVEVPIYVLNATSDAVRVELCSGHAKVPPQTRAEVHTSCLFGRGQLSVSGVGVADNLTVSKLTPSGLLYNVRGEAALYLADYSPGYEEEQPLGMPKLGGMYTKRPDFESPENLQGQTLVILPLSYPLLQPSEYLPTRVEQGHAVLRLEAIPTDEDETDYLQARFLDEPANSAPRERNWYRP